MPEWAHGLLIRMRRRLKHQCLDLGNATKAGAVRAHWDAEGVRKDCSRVWKTVFFLRQKACSGEYTVWGSGVRRGTPAGRQERQARQGHRGLECLPRSRPSPRSS